MLLLLLLLLSSQNKASPTPRPCSLSSAKTSLPTSGPRGFASTNLRLQQQQRLADATFSPFSAFRCFVLRFCFGWVPLFFLFEV